MHPELEHAACYRALLARDARFDGVFYTGVVSTGIFCRPVCPATPPKPENCVFLPSAAAAHRLGFRPCLRCRPELTPGIAGWRGTASTVSRALYLICEGALNDGNVDGLATRLGVSARHLRRLFERHVGASPLAVAQTQRILFAKKLLGESRLSMADIAIAAGFGSVRRFNDAMRRTYGRPPGELRRSMHTAAHHTEGVTVRLPYSPPYDWEAMLGFLASRAIAGVETVANNRYRRSFACDGAYGTLDVCADLPAHQLRATIRIDRIRALGSVVTRLRRLFDLDADLSAIDAHLAHDPLFAGRVRARPGLRVPGTWDTFELAVRAVLGQQISVAAATTLAGRLAAALGQPLESAVDGIGLLFPIPAVIATADLDGIGLTQRRAASLRQLAQAMRDNPHLLRPFETLENSIARLTELPGIGPWTAQYIAMRALREPDAFPASDLGLLRALETPAGRPTPAALLARAEAWRPWRAYAALRLWLQPDGAPA
ncbi:AlkA N-terminal domain-containing protein [Acidihalobacter ferrooxydans]|uniref:DNA-3-methyladenine glycosylase II n=1 Tax=Acidihalobacter ferrooxydans TaxID=1765967 RepID=A0A1P8UEA5_9GAMM|nr:AlkA N-terminal domain-containing protein [Acidihalobacter ferrooxydans]APZ42161.1 3-methyladenine DNA glycosylase 2 [Acidihalobacter ferrooxydans]